jgi:glycosyltransferase involved in cell wall biosynthesis
VRLLHFTRNVVLLYRWLRRCRPDILHINNGGYPGGESCRAAAVAAGLAGVPMVSMFVHNLAKPRQWPAVMDAGLDRVIGRRLDTMVAASRASATTLIRRRGFLPELLTPIPYGIDMPALTPRPAPSSRSRLGLPTGGVLVGSVARLEPRKGQNYLLEALALLRQRTDDVSVAIVGEGPSEAEYRSLATELGIFDRVVFTGQRADVADLMRAFDVFVMPSIDFESLPYALLEAMSFGKPIVATRVAGIPEAIEDGRSGLLIEPRDVEGLAAALLRLLGDPAERQRLGEAARARAETEYSLERMMSRTLDHYDRLLKCLPG